MAKQPKQSYRYTGPVTPLTLDDGHKMLYPGTPYTDLPADNPVVITLIARLLLTPEISDGTVDTPSPAQINPAQPHVEGA